MSTKKTETQKKQAGTDRKDRENNPLTYEPLTSVPDPLVKLENGALDYFISFCQILLSNKTLTNADVPVITRAAKWYEIYHKAMKEVDEKGALQRTNSGYSQKSGAFTVMADADDRIMKVESMYGMNLFSRMKINIPKPKEKSEFEKI